MIVVKRGIQKFEFHLLRHHFTIQVNKYSFPRALDFKGKFLPNSQLLRLNDWFARYNFEIIHIKGQDNIIVDTLSRSQQIQIITPAISYPVVLMVGPSRESSSCTQNPPGSYPPELGTP